MKNKFLLKKVAAMTLASAMVVTGVNVPYVQPVMAEETAGDVLTALYVQKDAVTVGPLDLPVEDWTNKPEAVITESVSGVTTTANFDMTADIVIDEAGYQSLGAAEDNNLKLQGVVKLGPKWSWTDSQDIPYLQQKDFVKTDDGYKTTVTIKFRDKEADALKGIYFEIVATGFSGNITFSNTTLTEVQVASSSEQLAYTCDQSADQAVDFTGLKEEDWDNVVTTTLAEDNDDTKIDATVSNNAVFRGKITADQDLYDSLAAEDSYVKIQTVMKLGDKWDWTQGGNYPQLTKADFTANGDGTYSANFEDKYSDIAGGALHSVILRFVGIGAKGNLHISDVTISNLISKDEPLPAKDPTVMEDFESYEEGADSAATGWANVDGWKYDNVLTPVVATAGGSKALKLDLDYTKNSTETWSEAKVNKKFENGFDVSAYNQLTYDIIYPATFENFQAKVFAKNSASDTAVIDKSTSVSGTKQEDGSMKATVTIKFTPDSNKIDDLTIGTVGNSTDFKGDVYIDNITLSQEDPTKDFVEITQTPDQSGDQADISAMPAKVNLVDEKATASTLALRSYLEGLSEVNQTIFGHHNDTHKAVRKGVESDVEDITGSISGLVGIDTLSLTGVEMGEKTMKENVAKAASIDIAAAKKGAIISLSAHIPNMSNAKIKKGGDYGYDFIDCDFAETKDLSGNCAEGILNGTYTDRYNAYLDVIVDYATQLGDIPVLFRPLHECDGGWFWWGSAATDKETYKALYRYTVDYLTSHGVHNFIYVYSPGGPVLDVDKYLERYPGDDSVDVLAFDYYDDYNAGDEYNETFVKHLETTCTNLKKLADKKGKIAAISETGVRVAKPDGSDQEGILVKDNPIKGHNWYKAVGDVAAKTGMPYVLLWANFMDTNFYVPYKYNDKLGHELINEFIDYYNDDSSIFANGTNFYGKAETKKVRNINTDGSVRGYFKNLFSKSVVKEPTDILLSATNVKASDLSVTLTNDDKKVVLPVKEDSKKGLYAELTQKDLDTLGKTDIGKATLQAGKTTLSELTFISFGQDKATLPKNVIDNFELYYGDVDYLNGTFSENSAAGCSSSFSLDSKNKASGNYGGSFDYTLKSSGSEVWTGRKKSLSATDFSEYNALTLWLKPDEKDLKTVIQLVSGGQDYEVNVHAFAATKDAKYVTIPFSAFIGKDSKTNDLNPKQIEAFAIWRNSTPKEVTDITSSIVFDDIQFVNVDEKTLKLEADGYALTDEPVKTLDQTPDQSPDQNPSETPSVQPSEAPSAQPSDVPSAQPSDIPSAQPSDVPSAQPSETPSVAPSTQPSAQPSNVPSTQPSETPSVAPSTQPSTQPSNVPSTQPSETPSVQPSNVPSAQPSEAPSVQPSEAPSVQPSEVPSAQPSEAPSTAPTPSVKPDKVSGLKGSKRTNSGFTLQWNKAKNADGYSIERYVPSKKKYVQILTTKYTTKKVSGLASATTHQIRVRAYKLNNGKKIYGSYSKVVKITTYPNKVSSLSVKSKKAGQVTISWKKVSNANGYQIYRSTSKNGKYTKVKDLTKTTYVDKNAKRGKKYYYKVRAYKKTNKKFYGSFSTVKTVKVKK